MSSPLGSIVGGYRVEREIGAGAMGVVYESTQLRSGRKVALKILRAWIARIPTNVERFRQEAQAGLRIRHPSVVETIEIGQDNEHHFLAMEFVSGVSLQRLMRKGGQLPTRLALQITEQLCSALMAAHGQGILHRDIKPQNVMITEAGVAKMMDFSLAKVLDSGTALTAAGSLVGTPMFMAPEQALGMKVDERCDIYSLGFLLYLMLAGRYPYQAEGQMALLERIITEPLPLLTEFRPTAHRYVVRVVHKAVHKERDLRYQTAEAFHRDLLTLMGGEAAPRPAGGLPQAEPVGSGSTPNQQAFSVGAADSGPEHRFARPAPAPLRGGGSSTAAPLGGGEASDGSAVRGRAAEIDPLLVPVPGVVRGRPAAAGGAVDAAAAGQSLPRSPLRPPAGPARVVAAGGSPVVVSGGGVRSDGFGPRMEGASGPGGQATGGGAGSTGGAGRAGRQSSEAGDDAEQAAKPAVPMLWRSRPSAAPGGGAVPPIPPDRPSGS